MEMVDYVMGQDWLQGLVGEWTFSFATAEDSEHPGVVAQGVETVRRIGSAAILLENRAEGDDGSHSATIILADASGTSFSGAVVGTAVDTLFVYSGSGVDDRTLVLETEGPAMTPGRETDRYRDVFHIIDYDNRFTTAEVQEENGAWREFMRTTYRRTI